MSNSVSAVILTDNHIRSLIKSLSASNLYHNNLDDSNFSFPNEKEEIIAQNKRLQDHLKTYLDQSLPSCPLSPESSTNTNRRLGCAEELTGGILPITKRLKEIKEEINLLNGSAFQNATLTDAQHYQLLDVEMFIDDFIAPYLLNNSKLPVNL